MGGRAAGLRRRRRQHVLGPAGVHRPCARALAAQPHAAAGPGRHPDLREPAARGPGRDGRAGVRVRQPAAEAGRCYRFADPSGGRHSARPNHARRNHTGPSGRAVTVAEQPANLTERLADFVTATRPEDLSDSARERARIVLADTVASALMGGRSAEVPMIERLAAAVAGQGDSPVVGRPSLAPAGAVLVNGYLITATTVCDVHKATLCHVTPEVFPPALAVAAERGASGEDFLLAFALGLEITSRVGLGSDYQAFRGNGWHSPGVWGPFGGAAAAGKLLGLDPRKMRNAFGLAGSQSAGTFAHWGTPTIKFHQSRGALSGYLAATLAGTGFEAGAAVLTAPDGGLYGTYSDGGKPELAVDGLGDRWELEQLSLRAWPL